MIFWHCKVCNGLEKSSDFASVMHKHNGKELFPLRRISEEEHRKLDHQNYIAREFNRKGTEEPT